MARTLVDVGRVVTTVVAVATLVIGLDLVRLGVTPKGDPIDLSHELRRPELILRIDSKRVDAIVTLTILTVGRPEKEFTARLSSGRDRLQVDTLRWRATRADTAEWTLLIQRALVDSSSKNAFSWGSSSALIVTPPRNTRITALSDWQVDRDGDPLDSAAKQRVRNRLQYAYVILVAIILIGGTINTLRATRTPPPAPLTTTDYVERLIANADHADPKRKEHIQKVLGWSLRDDRQYTAIIKRIQDEFRLTPEEARALYDEAEAELDTQHNRIVTFIAGNKAARAKAAEETRRLLEELQRQTAAPAAPQNGPGTGNA